MSFSCYIYIFRRKMLITLILIFFLNSISLILWNTCEDNFFFQKQKYDNTQLIFQNGKGPQTRSKPRKTIGPTKHLEKKPKSLMNKTIKQPRARKKGKTKKNFAGRTRTTNKHRRNLPPLLTWPASTYPGLGRSLIQSSLMVTIISMLQKSTSRPSHCTKSLWKLYR